MLFVLGGGVLYASEAILRVWQVAATFLALSINGGLGKSVLSRGPHLGWSESQLECWAADCVERGK